MKKCERCGSCCVQLRGIWDISEEDIRRWINEFRIDILQYYNGWDDECSIMMGNGENRKLVYYLTKDKMNMEMWCDPENREDNIDLCPFLRKKRGENQFECMIEKTKPEFCRNYICNPKNMMEIVKRSFEESLREFRKKRKIYASFVRTSPFIGNPLK
jgi:Fe-S-cluster containining protein